MRFAIWAAVSTAEQASPDKASLAEQENKCRQVGEAREWVEACPPFIASGHSRSFYVNLSDAEKDIPALREMLASAQQDQFDILIVYNYDRLGDLADMVAQSLSFYGKQIYSVNQPAEPQAPEHFDRYAAEAEGIMRDVARIWQRQRINDLRRKRQAGMPVRIKRGLTPSRVPFGYRWAGKQVPPELDEARAALVIQMKDMFLRGETVADIIRYANSTSIHPPEGGDTWQDSSIRSILSNPYYAGIVSILRYKTVRDPRAGRKPKQVKRAKSKWITGEGKHAPLWDEMTHKWILDEMERRHSLHVHHRVTYPFTGLVFCGVCGAKMVRVSHGHAKPRARFWVCSQGRTKHVQVPYQEGNVLIANKLVKAIQQKEVKPTPIPAPDRRQMEELQARRRRVQEAYEAGAYGKDELIGKIGEIEKGLEGLEDRIFEEEQKRRHLEMFNSQFGDSPDATRLFSWMLDTEPRVVNTRLRIIVNRVLMHPKGRVEVEL